MVLQKFPDPFCKSSHQVLCLVGKSPADTSNAVCRLCSLFLCCRFRKFSLHQLFPCCLYCSGHCAFACLTCFFGSLGTLYRIQMFISGMKLLTIIAFPDIPGITSRLCTSGYCHTDCLIHGFCSHVFILILNPGFPDGFCRSCLLVDSLPPLLFYLAKLLFLFRSKSGILFPITELLAITLTR